MSGQVRRSLALALAGLVAGLGLVLALFDGPGTLRRLAGGAPPEPPTAVAPPAPGAQQTDPSPPTPPLASTEARAPAQADAGKPAAAAGPEAPSFDIVRVEPNGDAVVAGRGAPNTVVEMLLDGKPVARALADPNGQFAIVPPALPAGSSEIVLRTKDADGRETRSRSSVAVAVSPRRDSRPLVALTAPDAPTVVLSQPGAPDQPATAPAAGRPAEAKTVPGKAQAARIVSVDAQGGGRLYVTGEAPPGSDLRLYLNDTLIAPARVGADGKVTFTIGRGVKPGRYQVRIDQVEAGTGKVRGRAEVPFAMPETVAAATPPSEPQRSEPRVESRAAPGAGPGIGAAPGATVATPGPQAAMQERPAAGRAAPPGIPQGTEAARDGAGRSADARPGPGAPGSTGTPAAETIPRAATPGLAGQDAGRPAAAASPPPKAPELAAAPPAAEPAPPGGVFVPEINTARITRGDSLWQISKRTYGNGHRYTVIYDANQEQIRDPDLIYPGQIFVLPTGKRG